MLFHENLRWQMWLLWFSVRTAPREAFAIWVKGLHAESTAPGVWQVMMEQMALVYEGIHSSLCDTFRMLWDWPEPEWMMPRHQQQPGVTPLVEGCSVCLTGDTQKLSRCNPVLYAGPTVGPMTTVVPPNLAHSVTVGCFCCASVLRAVA